MAKGRDERQRASTSSTSPRTATGTRCWSPSIRSDRRATAERGAASIPRAPSAERTTEGSRWLESLWATIAERAATRPEGSYTAKLLDGGVDATGRKVTEEATEVLMAAKDDAAEPTPERRAALAGESADLLYHLLVLLAERDVSPSAVLDELRRRHAK